MSEGILNGVRVIEGSAFVAAPTAGMTLAQLGADVIRFDAPGGGLDWKRWPLTSSGEVLASISSARAITSSRGASGPGIGVARSGVVGSTRTSYRDSASSYAARSWGTRLRAMA